jgi:hypothetical protein
MTGSATDRGDTHGLPDFIIIGAAKCGTTSLHDILSAHPDVFIPQREVYFFDVDDIHVHPDFFYPPGGMVVHDYERDFAEYLDWYRSFFEPAKPRQVIGEDSTTYISSRRAAARIDALLPDARLVVMLRDPVARAYSQYWHNVRAGRIVASFEQTLRTAPGPLLQRGFYAEQLARFRPALDDGRLLVVFFEDFVAEREGVVARVCEHIGVPALPELTQGEQVSNRSEAPWNIPLRLAANRVIRPWLQVKRNIPNMPGYHRTVDSQADRPGHEKLVQHWDARLPSRRVPPMSEQTRSFLERVFANENAALGEIIGEDVASRWPYMPAR